MEKNRIRLYNGLAYGVKVSDYGLESGYLDYHALSNIIGNHVLNNSIREATMTDWEIVAGEFDEMIFQDYIITESGYRFLEEYTDELVFYNDSLNMYIWSVTHFGTSWDYVLTDIELIGGCKPMTECKWYGFEMNKRDAEKFKEYLNDNDIYFEPSSAYDVIHFECEMTEEELRFTEKWFQKNLLIL